MNQEGDLVLQDHVLVEAEAAGRPISFRTLVVKIGPEELWLGLASPDHRLEMLEPGRAVRLTVGRTGFALLGHSTFLRHMGESRSRIFAVTRGQSLERVQRRAHPRIDVEMEVRLRMLDALSGEVRGKAANGVTVNAGPGGLLFRPDVEMAAGDSAELTVSLCGGDRLIAPAKVTRVGEDGRPADGQAPGRLVAVSFLRITAVDQQRLLRAACLIAEHRRQVAAREAQTGRAPDATATAATGTAAAENVPAASLLTVVPDSEVLAAAVARAKAAQAARLAQKNAVAQAADNASAAAISAVAARAVTELAAGPSPTPLSPIEARLAELPAGTPLAQVGLALCDAASVPQVRQWFDHLEPFDRIGLLSQLQANMHGEAVPGASEPYVLQPLVQALGLVQKSA